MLRIDKIITSKLRLKILRYFFLQKSSSRATIRQLSRELNCSPSHVSKELSLLKSAGILANEKLGNQKLYYCIYSGQLQDVFKKEPQILLEKLRDVTGVKLAYVYENLSNGFKIIIIGNPDIYFLNRVIRNIENDGNFTVQFNIIKEDEVYKKNIPKPMLFITGDKILLEQIKSKSVRISKLHDYRKKRRWKKEKKMEIGKITKR